MSIDKSEVLRYLGHRGQAYDQRLDELIDEAVLTCQAVSRPQHVLRIFDLQVSPAGASPLLAGANLTLPGADIARHLAGASKCALLAATLGVEIEARIRMLEQTDLTASLILDAAATDCIEKHCDEAGELLRDAAGAQGLYPGTRYSPGYGDLPLTLQPQLLRLLDAGRRIGLTCTDHLILLPRKSVTAIIGLFEHPVPSAHRSCEHCPIQATCRFRRAGSGCAAPNSSH